MPAKRLEKKKNKLNALRRMKKDDDGMEEETEPIRNIKVDKILENKKLAKPKIDVFNIYLINY